MSVSTPIVILLEAGLLAVPALTTLGAALPPPAWPPPSGFLQAVAAPTAAAHSITRRDRSAIRWVIRENIATPGSAGVRVVAGSLGRGQGRGQVKHRGTRAG